MLTNSLNLPNGGAGAPSDKVATSAPVGETRDMFTKLLVAQIQNQDPLSPSDPSQFVNQLSTLSQTESLQKLADTQSASASVLQSLQVLAMGAQVGSSVSVATSSVRVGDAPITGTIQLGGASSVTRLTLVGADGQPHVLTLAPHGPGALPFTIDPGALGLPPGSYAIQAQAADGTVPAVEVNGCLEGVRLSATGGALLQVANVGEVAPSAITEFNGKAGTATAL